MLLGTGRRKSSFMVIVIMGITFIVDHWNTRSIHPKITTDLGPWGTTSIDDVAYDPAKVYDWLFRFTYLFPTKVATHATYGKRKENTYTNGIYISLGHDTEVVVHCIFLFSLWEASCTKIISSKDFPLSIALPCQKLIDCICMGPFLDSLFC